MEFINICDIDTLSVNLAVNETTKVSRFRIFSIYFEINLILHSVQIFDTLLVLERKTNLFIPKLCGQQCIVTFRENCVIIKNLENVEFIADCKNDLYYLHSNDSNCNITSLSFFNESVASSKNNFLDIMKWHASMRHLNFKDLLESCKKVIFEN